VATLRLFALERAVLAAFIPLVLPVAFDSKPMIKTPESNKRWSRVYSDEFEQKRKDRAL
jgi:hypothetical protein